MGFFSGVKRQLRSVIEWKDASPEDLFYRWSDNGDEIKNASKLLVNPGQGCIFVYQGKVESVFEEEGLYNLKTDNIPFWTTITKFMQSFESEHKVGIYFFKKTKILNQKWGTTSPIKYNDPIYKFPVALRAYGNYSFRIKDARGFFVNISGNSEKFTVADFRQVMSSRIVQPLTDYFAECSFSYADIDKNREEIAQAIHQKLQADFEKLGFQIEDFRIEGNNFDEDTMKRINRIADMTAEAQAAAAVGLNYAQVQQLEAMKDAAKNEGGGAGLGMGLGAGLGMGQMMSGAMASNFGQQNQQQNQAQKQEDPMEKLKKLKQMFEMELISEEEYKTKKKEILDTM